MTDTSATIAPDGLGRISPFPKATVPHQCASPWPCDGVAPGQPGAYIGTAGGLVVVCAPCAERVRAEQDGAPAPAPAPDDAWEMTGPEQLVTPPAELVDTADLAPWDGPLCGCTRGAHTGTGFARALEGPAVGRWVHTGCGLPAVRGVAQSTETAVEDDGPPATPHRPDPTEVEESDADRAADAAHAEWVADQADGQADGQAAEQVEDWHECACARVTKKATIGRTPDGRPTHEHCGGLLREKHRHLAPQPETTESTTESEAQTHDGDDAGDPDGDAGAGAGPGVEARPADGPARAGEGGDDSGEGSREGDHGRDQGRGVPAGGPGDPGGDDPQPAHGAPVEGGAPRGVADRLEGPQGGGPAHVDEVGEEDRELAARRGEVAGALAAFLAQPVEDDTPAHTLADFFGQPVEDVESWGGPVNAPDSDNYLGEFSITELVAEIGSRPEIARTVVGLVVAVGPGRWTVELQP